MQLRHLKNVLPATEGMCKVTAIAWAPNNKRLAVVTVERVVHLFDANTGERKDKFSTKPAEKVNMVKKGYSLSGVGMQRLCRARFGVFARFNETCDRTE